MPIDPTVVVVAGMLDPDGCFDPPHVPSPAGITYQWVNTTLMGEPDLKTLRQRMDNGWSFVPPTEQPALLALSMGKTMECRGFCLMSKSTVLIDEQRARERAPHMDLDTRVLSIMERYTGEAQTVNVGGINMRASIRHKLADGTAPSPLETPDEVCAELAKRGFPDADIRLFMKRHFGA